MTHALDIVGGNFVNFVCDGERRNYATLEDDLLTEAFQERGIVVVGEQNGSLEVFLATIYVGVSETRCTEPLVSGFCQLDEYKKY